MVAAAHVYNNHLPAVATTATSPMLSGISDWTFRVISSDSANGRTIARSPSVIKYKRAVILYENNSYGRGLADNFRRAFGGQVLSFDPIAEGTDQNFEPYVSWYKHEKPDVVFVAGTDASGLAFLHEARRQQLTAELVGGDGWRLSLPHRLPRVCSSDRRSARRTHAPRCRRSLPPTRKSMMARCPTETPRSPTTLRVFSPLRSRRWAPTAEDPRLPRRPPRTVQGRDRRHSLPLERRSHRQRRRHDPRSERTASDRGRAMIAIEKLHVNSIRGRLWLGFGALVALLVVAGMFAQKSFHDMAETISETLGDVQSEARLANLLSSEVTKAIEEGSRYLETPRARCAGVVP